MICGHGMEIIFLKLNLLQCLAAIEVVQLHKKCNIHNEQLQLFKLSPSCCGDMGAGLG